jgi:hypothetical protein
MVGAVKMLCVDGPAAGKHLDIPYPCMTVWVEPETYVYSIFSPAAVTKKREHLYHCHRYRLVNTILLIGSVNAESPADEDLAAYMLSDAAREAIQP